MKQSDKQKKKPGKK
jgi:hypothetical protein